MKLNFTIQLMIYSWSLQLLYEIEKIIICDELVENWTYPLIQPKLIEEATKEDIYKTQFVGNGKLKFGVNI